MKISANLVLGFALLFASSVSMAVSAIAENSGTVERLNTIEKKNSSRTETVDKNETIAIRGQKDNSAERGERGSKAVQNAAGKILNLANQPGAPSDGNKLMEEERIFYYRKNQNK